MLYALREYFFYCKRLLYNYKGRERTKMLGVYTVLFLKYIFLVKLFKVKITRQKFLGFNMKFFNYYTFYGLFEEIFLTKQYYFETKNSTPVILDCGSNMGMSVLYFIYLYKGAKITAFEPDPDTFKLLMENMLLNNADNVTVVNAALYDTEKEIDLFLPDKEKGSLQMSLSENRNKKSASTKIKTVLLSGYIGGKIDFVKMDIEGAESAVIRELVKQDKMKEITEMALEIHHNIDLNEEITSEIFSHIARAGFKYQISAPLLPAFKKGVFQDILVYAYRK